MAILKNTYVPYKITKESSWGNFDFIDWQGPQLWLSKFTICLNTCTNSAFPTAFSLWQRQRRALVTIHDKSLQLRKVAFHVLGSKPGAVVIAPVSHQCGTGLVPGLEAICGLSLLLVFFVCSERFFYGFSCFPPSTKTNNCKFQFYLDARPPWKPTPGTRVELPG